MKFEITLYLVGAPYYHVVKSETRYNIFSIASAIYEIAAAISTINVKVEDIEDCVVELIKNGVSSLGETDNKTSSYITVRRV